MNKINRIPGKSKNPRPAVATASGDDRMSEQPHDFLSDFPPIPPEPLLEISRHIEEGFNYSRRCLRQANRLIKRVASLEKRIADLEQRQVHLENLTLQKRDTE